MTDLHTHILPGIDDGAKSAEESVEMLRMQQSQGVHTVVLTPHFYPHQEDVSTFLARREEAMGQLRECMDARPLDAPLLPRLLLGAEVLWRSDLNEEDGLDKLCIEGTKNLLLELPFVPWNVQLIDQLYDMMGRTGITPIIAHLERYIPMQPQKLVQEILELGVPVQISAEILSHPFMRREAMKLLKKGQAHLLASDCHDCTQRMPNLAAGIEIVRRKLGNAIAQELCACAEGLIRS